MKPRLLVGGDSFAEFHSYTTDPRDLQQRWCKIEQDRPRCERHTWDGRSRHWCEQWAERVGCEVRSVGYGGSSNDMAANMTVRALLEGAYTHLVYYITDVNRTVKRDTSHLASGDRAWDARDYIDRRWRAHNAWMYKDIHTSLLPEEMPVCTGGDYTSLSGKYSKQYVQGAMNLTPTHAIPMNSIAHINMVDSLAQAQGVRVLYTSGFIFPRSLRKWFDLLGSRPTLTIFGDNTVVEKDWDSTSHYTHKQHARLLKHILRSDLGSWLTV